MCRNAAVTVSLHGCKIFYRAFLNIVFRLLNAKINAPVTLLPHPLSRMRQKSVVELHTGKIGISHSEGTLLNRGTDLLGHWQSDFVHGEHAVAQTCLEAFEIKDFCLKEGFTELPMHEVYIPATFSYCRRLKWLIMKLTRVFHQHS